MLRRLLSAAGGTAVLGAMLTVLVGVAAAAVSSSTTPATERPAGSIAIPPKSDAPPNRGGIVASLASRPAGRERQGGGAVGQRGERPRRARAVLGGRDQPGSRGDRRWSTRGADDRAAAGPQLRPQHGARPATGTQRLRRSGHRHVLALPGAGLARSLHVRAGHRPARSRHPLPRASRRLAARRPAGQRWFPAGSAGHGAPNQVRDRSPWEPRELR